MAVDDGLVFDADPRLNDYHPILDIEDMIREPLAMVSPFGEETQEERPITPEEKKQLEKCLRDECGITEEEPLVISITCITTKKDPRV